MHMTIGSIVYADTPEDAIETAKSDFESLADGSFDYYSLRNAEGADEEIAYSADSETGIKLISKRMEWTKQCFMENIKKLRDILEGHTDEMLYNNKANLFELKGDYVNVRYPAYCVGRYTGPYIWLYHETSGIRSDVDLQKVLDNEGGKTWIVLADVHY